MVGVAGGVHVVPIEATLMLSRYNMLPQPERLSKENITLELPTSEERLIESVLHAALLGGAKHPLPPLVSVPKESVLPVVQSVMPPFK